MSLVLRLVTIVFAPMQWGVMDDVTWIEFFKANPVLHFGPFIANTLRDDLHWGLFRPTYFSWAYGIYKVLGLWLSLSPRFLYGLCFLIHTLTGLGYGFVFLKLDGSPSKEKDSKFLRVFLFFLFFWAFTPGLNLINLISLQERLALCFGLGAFLLILLTQGSQLLRLSLAYFCFLLALGAKSTSVVFSLPLALILFRKKQRITKLSAILFLVTAVLWALFAAWVAKSGTYTSRYGASLGMFAKYFQLGGSWAVVVFLVTFGAFFVLWRRRLLKSIEVIWPMTVLGLVCLMLPWGIYGYYWSIFTPFVAGCFSILFLYFRKSVDYRLLLLIPLVGYGISVGPKLQKLINRSVSTHTAAEWLQARPEKQVFIPAPCYEAAQSFGVLSKHSVVVWRGSTAEAPSGTLFFTWWECATLPSISGRTFQLVQDFGDWKVFSVI